ncbi:MAG: arginine deiminase-related protein [Actinomycetota bacterium]|nr:arginine deiminase-related protein [Actinomycetota bacterium]
MCRPDHFDVTYEINPWMDSDVEVDRDLALQQWETLRAAYAELGHSVQVIEGAAGQPDMVFAANAGTVVGGLVVAAKFLRAERTGEERPYRAWFRAHYADVVSADFVNEGEGDYLWTGSVLLAGSGFRTDPRAHASTAAALNVRVVPLELVSPHFYHLDTALAILGADEIAYLPEAFSASSQRLLRELYPDAVIATLADASWFGLNATSDGKNVVVAAQAEQLRRDLAAAGYTPVPVDVSEFRKAGGGIKCCTLELRD